MIAPASVFLPKPLVFYTCTLALVAATGLLYAGGFTTSIEAGMAFLDWPLSNGSINPEGWLLDREMRAEHSHRLLSMAVGMLAITLTVILWYRESRAWVRLLSLVTLALVIAQGILGGLRVRLDVLNTGAETNITAQTFAMLHAIGAQVVVCGLVSLAIASSRAWIEGNGGFHAPAGARLRALGIATCAVLFIQILIGALVRHTDSGLAITTFPHSTGDGQWLPEYWNWAVALNLSHRAGAIVASVAILAFIAQIWAASCAGAGVKLWAILPVALLAIQVFLGAMVTWTGLNEHAATLHLLVGAFLLASCWTLTFLSFRLTKHAP